MKSLIYLRNIQMCTCWDTGVNTADKVPLHGAQMLLLASVDHGVGQTWVSIRALYLPVYFSRPLNLTDLHFPYPRVIVCFRIGFSCMQWWLYPCRGLFFYIKKYRGGQFRTPQLVVQGLWPCRPGCDPTAPRVILDKKREEWRQKGVPPS